MISRGIRNCNPGNIRLSLSRFQGEVVPSQDSQFKQFESAAWGYRAMFLVIHNYNKLYGINTLRRIIARWAPECENDTQRYIQVVAKRLGISVDGHINSRDGEQMRSLVWSMSKIENGVDPDIDEVSEGWALFEGSI